MSLTETIEGDEDQVEAFIPLYICDAPDDDEAQGSIFKNQSFRRHNVTDHALDAYS